MPLGTDHDIRVRIILTGSAVIDEIRALLDIAKRGIVYF